MANEQRTRQQDQQAFFDLPRSSLLAGALVTIVLLGVLLVAGYLTLPRLGFWAVAAFFAVLAGVEAWLRRTPVGRGLLWTFGKGYAPRTQMIGSLVLAALFAAVALYVHWPRP